MMRVSKVAWLGLLMTFFAGNAFAQPFQNSKYGQEDKFRQLEEILPTANGYRNAAGAPGPRYWQQQADYVIDVALDDDKQHLTGSEKITYFNNSPDTLRYIWLQIDANIYGPDSDSNVLQSYTPQDRVSIDYMEKMQARIAFDGSAKITRVEDGNGNPLKHTVVKTMMRIDLPTPLQPGGEFKFEIDWNYRINDSDLVSGRTGCEFFEKDGNYIYEMAQWFPRMAAYTDANGWQHKQFLGSGEFALEFGDYLVSITAPEDHIVASTGVLQNEGEVLTDEQQERFRKSKTAETPMFVVTPEEALENQKEKASGTKTWVFEAENVRDFAWASSRKFIWDAQGHNVEGNEVMAMSYYPNEAEPLWSKYSTHSIIHTLNVYSRYTFAYPYPTAISVNGPVYGMEYPMICFNGPRPEEDGTYSARTKYGLISVVIHEVGHNYFPMIVNSDERQWTWMDEGLNTFLQYLAEQEWEDDYPSRRGEPSAITSYMLSDRQVPIMTNSESILQFGNNAYAKPATALNVLRETVLGRELFDFSFKEYARRWKFKRPMPADFFRTMEDASGVDLDWFWRGWFYTTEHCDISVEGVNWLVSDDGNPETAAERARAKKAAETPTLSETRNEELAKRANEFPELKDFYNSYDPLDVTPESRQAFQRMLEKMTDEEKKILQSKQNFYTISLKNVGGLVMPVILRMTYEDGSEEIKRLPVEIWVQNNETARTSIISEKALVSVELDPYRETADVNRDNNFFPPRLEPSRFQLYKSEGGGRRGGGDNPMKAAKRREEAAAKKAAEEKKKAEEKAAAEKAAAEKAAEEEEKPADESAAVEEAAEEKPAEEKEPVGTSNG